MGFEETMEMGTIPAVPHCNRSGRNFVICPLTTLPLIALRGTSPQSVDQLLMCIAALQAPTDACTWSLKSPSTARSAYDPFTRITVDFRTTPSLCRYLQHSASQRARGA